MSETKILCGECGGLFTLTPHRDGSEYATCGDCGHMVHIASDIAPNMEPGERIVWTDGLLAYVAAVA